MSSDYQLYVLAKSRVITMKNLEKIDLKILKELLKDGRKSFTAIAEECHTSKDIIWKHYKEMKMTGVIVGTRFSLIIKSLATVDPTIHM